MQRTLKAALPEDALRRLAGAWQVSTKLLRELGIGWSKQHQAYSFPERDSRGQIVGIMLRDAQTGEKQMMFGGHRGLYFITEWQASQSPILLPEGVSDTAALLAHGLTAVGRPSCNGGANHLIELLDDVVREIVVVGDNDEKADGRWPGRDSARELAEKLANRLGRKVQWALPPKNCKDVRDWLSGGDGNGR